MMDPGEVITAVTFFVTSSVTIVTLARMWINRRPKGAPPKSLEAIEERLGRMEQAMDAIAIEVERISEGQRFTTKLLAERAREPAELPGARQSR